MRSEVLAAVKMSMLFFRVVTPSGNVVGRYQGCGETTSPFSALTKLHLSTYNEPTFML
jgi:hypothetical protein